MDRSVQDMNAKDVAIILLLLLFGVAVSAVTWRLDAQWRAEIITGQMSCSELCVCDCPGGVARRPERISQ